MRMTTNRRALGLLAALTFVVVAPGCAPSDPAAPEITRGAVPANRVVALGNSLTAGFTNEALFAAGQFSGYANLVARSITGADMTMPLVASPGIASTLNTSGPVPIPQGQLYVTALGQLAYRQLDDPANVTGLLLASALPLPYDNLGVPGAYVGDVASTTNSTESQRPSNLYFDLILRNSALPPGGSTQLSQLEALGTNVVPGIGTLLLWIGSNDVLLGATTGNPAVGGNVTTVADFQSELDTILAGIAPLGIPQVAIMNIPSITSIPIMTSIVGLLQANSLTPADISTEEDGVALILLTAQSLLFPGGNFDTDYLDGTKTLPSSLTLTAAEVTAVETTVAGYNSYIAGVATARGWALVDVNQLLADLPTDPTAPLNAVFPLVSLPTVGLVQNTGSAFGLDGVHPSQKGYARIANEVLTELNATYGTSYATYDVSMVQNTFGFEEFSAASSRATFAVDPDNDPFQNVVRSLARQ